MLTHVIGVGAAPSLADHGIFCINGTSAHKYTGYDNSNDVLTVSSTDENSTWIMAGKGGTDELTGGTIKDYLCGNDGDDLAVFGVNGSDESNGGYGEDAIFSGNGQDESHGGEDPDLLDGMNNDDQLYGDKGADRLEDSGSSDGDYGSGGPGTNDECSMSIDTRVLCEIVT